MKNNKNMLRNAVTMAALLSSVSLFGLDIVEDVNVDGTVTIQSTASDATFSIDDDGAGVNPTIPDDLGTLINPIAATTPVYTQLGGADVVEESTENTGIIAETNGDLTLLSDLGTTETFSYIRAVRNDVYNADQPDAGDTAQVQNIGGYIDPDTGVFVELGLLAPAEVWDAAFIGTDLEGELILNPATVLTAEEQALLVVTEDIPGTGGNLQVGGNANVDGSLTVGGVNVVETLDTHFGLVSQNIADIAANSDTLDVHFGLVSQNIADIAANSETLDVHFGLVSQNITDIAANATAIADEAAVRATADEEIVAGYMAADADLAQGIADEAAARAAADNAEIAARAAADEDLAAAIAAGDSAEAAARAAADEDLADGIAANSATLNTHFGLVSNNIANIAKNRADIDTNTRGIAMVAAMTHSTILPGMENALDISAAYFEGETGFAISYSRRINENTQINFAAASTSDFDESVVRGGIGWQW